MISLFNYNVLKREVFYKCWHILEYIVNHPDMSNLEKKAINATIMDALVTRKQIDPQKQSLDIDHLCIVDNLDHYIYEKNPNICGIPLWMKDEFRKKSICITGGIPISMFLAKAPSESVRFCIYDPNIAVSSIFSDATFYEVVYFSPTRGIKIKDSRPFVEVNINGELYLIDTLTKRILKSSWFKENYGFEIISQESISEMDIKRLTLYKESISEYKNLSVLLPILLPFLDLNIPDQAEMKYEVEQSKLYFKGEWKKYNEFQEEILNKKLKNKILSKKKNNKNIH